MQIDLIRHAESTANIGLPVDRPDNVPLTDKGRQQALALSRTFNAASPPDLIVVSAYSRTAETAAPTIARFPDVPCEVWPVHEFTQLAVAKYHGTCWNDRTSDNSNYWSRNDPDYIDGPGAESFSQLIARVDETIERAARLPHKHTAIFTHGMFMRALFLRITRPELDNKALMQATNESRHTLKVPNTSRMRLSLSDHGKLIPGFSSPAT